MKRKTKTPDEFDVVTGWYKVLCCYQRPGQRDKVKRGMRRRERREAKQAIRKGTE